MQLIRLFVLGLLAAIVVGCGKMFERPKLNESEFIAKVVQAPVGSVDGLRYTYQGGVGGYAAVARFVIKDSTWIERRFVGSEVVEFDVRSETGQLQIEYLREKIRNAAGTKGSAIETWMELPTEGTITLRKVNRLREELLLIAPKGGKDLLLIAGEK